MATAGPGSKERTHHFCSAAAVAACAVPVDGVHQLQQLSISHKACQLQQHYCSAASGFCTQLLPRSATVWQLWSADDALPFLQVVLPQSLNPILGSIIGYLIGVSALPSGLLTYAGEPTAWTRRSLPCRSCQACCTGADPGCSPPCCLHSAITASKRAAAYQLELVRCRWLQHSGCISSRAGRIASARNGGSCSSQCSSATRGGCGEGSSNTSRTGAGCRASSAGRGA